MQAYCPKSRRRDGGCDESRYTSSGRHLTNRAKLDRLPLPLTAQCGGLSVDHGQKREFGGVTVIGRLDITWPITEGRELITSLCMRRRLFHPHKR